MSAKKPGILLAALLALLSAGCGSNVTLDAPTIPNPLVSPMPMSVALRIPDNFEHFVHEEEVLGRQKWTIDLGRSNAALFTQLFGFMFDEVTVIGPDDDAATLTVDALVEPTIDAFEFSVPSQSRTDSYAVWIRYRLKVYDHAGDQVANWPLSAYGKSQQTGMSGVDPLKRAAILAMRDAAALMILNLDKSTSISALKDRTPGTTIIEPEEATQEQAEKESPQPPARKAVALPPPGPVSGPAEISFEPDEAANDDDPGAGDDESD